ncbi:MAG: DUF2288 domain-containing protein [Cyanobacteria bacterium P01_H01_bin.130]
MDNSSAFSDLARESANDAAQPPMDLRQQLTAAQDEAAWEWLEPHAKRDAIIWVSDEIDLVDVGMAIASDDTTQVQRWIDEQVISKPTAQQLGDWNEDNAIRFNSLIVAPFVLIKTLG